MLFFDWFDIFDMYLFHVIVLLNPAFNYSNNLLLSQFERVTTGTCNLAWVILIVTFLGAFIAGLAGLSLCAGTTACIVISVKV